MTDSVEPRAATGVREAWMALAITLAAAAAAMLVDRTVYQWLHAPSVYDRDLGRLLRVMGFGGTWIALALAVGLVSDGGPARARRRGWLLFWSPMLAGAVAELLKIVVRRERPGLHDGAYGFRAWDERTWSGAGLAFPSSHTAVAFGGAAMLARLFPRARWVGYALAVGCAATRVFARAHFVSDVVFAAGLGWLVSWALWRRFGQVAAIALLVAAMATPRVLTAQAAVAPRTEACTVYRECAYNLVPRGLGLAVVRGEAEVHVATLGFLWPSSMEAAFAGDGEDARLARRAVRVRWVAAALTDIGIAATALAAVRASGDGGADDAARAALAVGLVSLGASVPLQFRADGLLARAVWHYNARFAR